MEKSAVHNHRQCLAAGRLGQGSQQMQQDVEVGRQEGVQIDAIVPALRAAGDSIRMGWELRDYWENL
jgi:hypothetical protein